MRTLLSFVKKVGSIKKENLKKVVSSFDQKQLFIFRILIGISLISTLLLLNKLNQKFLVSIPDVGGSITEGIIGTPVQINPVLAISDADEDMVSIVYSGLMRKDINGDFIPDIAKNYTISENGTVYTFVLRNDVFFHDGKNLTIDDVLFTVSKMQDKEIKSPKNIVWDGVVVEKINEETISFTIKQPYISFIENMNFGILPKHLWENVDSNQFSVSSMNIKAVGSGPYKIDSVDKDSDGIPREYTLSAFKKFNLGKPNVKNLHIVVYPNEIELVAALKNGNIDQAGGISPENVRTFKNENFTINETTLPRIFGLFLNISKSKILSDQNNIEILNKIINKQEIIDEVLYGHGDSINHPIPKTILNTKNPSNSISNTDAVDLLEKNGWQLNESGTREKSSTVVTTKTITKKVGKKTVTEKVSTKSKGAVSVFEISITTGDTPELKSASLNIKKQLENYGIKVDIKTYESGQLSQIIRNRDYEILLFGQVVNSESDLYSFWHSSQKTDPGLNIALYSNEKVDALLSGAQKNTNKDERTEIYKNIANEFTKNTKAIFLYSPKYIYITRSNIKNTQTSNIINTADRFSAIYTWYAKENYVWKIFTK